MKIKKETIKRTIFLLIVLIAFSILAQQAEAINTFYTTQSTNATFETAQAESDLRSGLVGHWSFNTADKSNSTNATDKSGLQNHGTVTGATFTNEGRFKEGYKFDGEDSYISIDKTNFQWENNSITISAWFKYNNLANYHLIWWQRTDSPPRVIYHYVNYLTNKMRYWVNSEAGGYASDGSITISPNTWYHSVMIIDKDNARLLAYLNNVLDLNISIGATGNLSIPVNPIIGSAYGTSNFWNGTIDEVRIYNRSLSASEVAALYNGTKSAHITLKADPTLGIVNTTADLVGYWTFDSKDGSNATNATDKSGLQNHGTVTGATFTNEGRFKEGYKFDGVNDEIDAPSNGWVNNNITFSAWVKKASNPSSYPQIVGDEGTRGALYIAPTTGQAFFQLTFTININKVTPSYSLNNNWHHLAGTWSSGDKLKFYVDGTLFSQSAAAYTDTIQAFTGFDIAEYGGTYFNGTIDEVRIYNRSLSASEVAALYNGTKSSHIQLKATPTLGIPNTTADLVGYWTFDTKDKSNATNATDKSGMQNHGAVTGATFTNEGRFKEGYKFDGVNDYLIRTNYTDFNFTSKDNFTISAWVKVVGGQGTFRTIAGKYPNGVAGYDFYANNNNKFAWYVRNDTTAISSVSTTSVALNTWQHITVWYNGTHQGIYVNGISEDTDVSLNLGSNERSFMIGARFSTAPQLFFNGSIDEVRIYNRSLSASEVAGLYNGTRSTHLKLLSIVG